MNGPSPTSKPPQHLAGGNDVLGVGVRSIERIAAEHEARGLLNLIVLVTRCLESGGLPGRKAEQFVAARAEADERLDRLYNAGLPRDFHRTGRATGPVIFRGKAVNPMGDKSPKAAKKQASQKRAKSETAEQKKRQDVAAKQVWANKK